MSNTIPQIYWFYPTSNYPVNMVYVPEPIQYWPDAVGIEPILALFWHIMPCFQGMAKGTPQLACIMKPAIVGPVCI